MSTLNYAPVVIGSVERMPVRLRHATAPDLVDLTGIDVTIRILGPGTSGAVIVSDATCTVSGVDAYYDWDTAGLTAGKYYVQFSFDLGGAPLAIKPPTPAEVRLVARLGE